MESDRAARAAELLAHVPPGETADALQDLADILGGPEDMLSLHDAVRDHNIDSLCAVSVTLPGGAVSRVILSQFNMDTDGSFFDPATGTRFTVNHFNLSEPSQIALCSVAVEAVVCQASSEMPESCGDAHPAVGASENEAEHDSAAPCLSRDINSGHQMSNDTAAAAQSSEVQSISEQSPEPQHIDPRSDFAKGVARAAEEYVKESLHGIGAAQVTDTSDGGVALVIVGEKIQPKNMRSGQWQSVWLVKHEGQQLSVSGRVRLCVHTYEEGNVQLRAEKTIDIALDAANHDEACQRLIAAIREREDAFQLAINSAYGRLGDGVFKRLRRQLPVTRAKLDWAKLAAYRVGADAAGQHAAASNP